MGDWQKGVVSFDVDGTLTDTGRAHILFCNDINREFKFGLPEIDPDNQEAVRKILANPMTALMKNYGFPQRALEELDEKYAARFAINQKYTSKPFEGVEEMLLELNSRGLYLMILSSNTIGNIRRDLGEKIWKLFDKVIAKEQLREFYQGSKGRALHATIVQEFDNMPPRGLLHIGDMESDYEATNMALSRFMAVGYGWQLRQGDSRFPVAGKPEALTGMIVRAFPSA